MGIKKLPDIIRLVFTLAAIICSFHANENTVYVEASAPVILIAAFGSTYKRGQKNLEDFDKSIRSAFPDNRVIWGFTSRIVVKKLLKAGKKNIFESGVPVRLFEDVIEDLKMEGVKKVVIVNLLLMIGQEYRLVMNTPVTGMDAEYVHPLLYYPDNKIIIIRALEDYFGSSDEAAVLCAHGNARSPEYNADFIEIDNYLRENYINTCLAVMEGTPSFDSVKENIRIPEIQRVKFVSFMLTYGDHMTNDVMGDQADSFKNQLNLPAESTEGLASHPLIQAMFIDKIKPATAS